MKERIRHYFLALIFGNNPSAFFSAFGFSLLLLIGSTIVSLGKEQKGLPLKERRYSTKELHQLSKEIYEEIKSIEDMQGAINESKCPEVKRILSELSGKEKIYESIDSWGTNKYLAKDSKELNLKNDKLLTVDENHIIKKERLTFKWANAKEAMPFFKKEMQNLKKELRSYRGELKVFRKRLQVCYRRFSNCKDILENSYSRDRTRDIKYLVGLSLKKDEELLVNADDIRRSLKVKENNIVDERNKNQFCSEYFGSVEYGLIGYLKYRLSGRVDTASCSKAHNHWSRLRGSNFRADRFDYLPSFIGDECELNYLQEKSEEWNFGIILDSIWIIEQQAKSSDCAAMVRICPCEEEGKKQLSPNQAVTRDPACIGCMDSLALNFCPFARYSGPCKYLVCEESCFVESDASAIYPNYDPERDELIYDSSICKTNICGCMDEACENYDKTAKIPDDSCNCGCLESWAVNDASNENSIYYNPAIKYNDPSKCHKRGCTSPCATNYDPRAEIDDGSCKCELVTRGQLESAKNALALEQVDRNGSARLLRDEFRSIFQDRKGDVQTVAKKLEFERGTNDRDDLVVKGKLKVDGIGLGQWTYPAIYEVIESLLDFLDTEMSGAGGILHENLEVKIIGEADGHRIKYPGLVFNEEPFAGSPFKIFYPYDNIDLDYMAQDEFPIKPNKVANLMEGDYIRDNLFLGFVRAGMVKRKLLIRGSNKVNPENIYVGARENQRKGGAHRAISVVFIVRRYFRYTGGDELDRRKTVYEEAIKYYDDFGYPVPGKSYSKCPCIEIN